MRINRYLSDCGYCSRRKADELIRQGKVQIDGKTAVLGDQVNPQQKVTVKGQLIQGNAPKVYLAFHKPRGVICTTDTRVKDNIIDYIGYPERIFPVGRLDKDSEGLILLTSDGDIVNKILRAEHNHHKEYLVEVDKNIRPQDLRALVKGVEIYNPVHDEQVVAKAVSAKYAHSSRAMVLVLNTGLNRQIRRMCEALGYQVTRLIRTRIMHVKLGKIPYGHYRLLTKEEIGGFTKG